MTRTLARCSYVLASSPRTRVRLAAAATCSSASGARAGVLLHATREATAISRRARNIHGQFSRSAACSSKSPRMITFVSRGHACLIFRSGIALLFCAGAIALAATGNRHTQPNSQSPAADTSVTLGGHAITIEYNAPSARGRKVEGGLIPYDSWYRLGADAATTLTTDADVTIGDLRVPKGVHTLFLYATANGP